MTSLSISLRFDRADTLALAGLKRVSMERPELRVPALNDEARTLAQNAWKERLRSEYIGVMVMRHFHGLCVDLNAPMDLQEAALAMTLQEQQHAALCADAVVALGAEPHLDFDVDELQFARSSAPLEVQFFDMLVATFAVGEVVALELLRHTLAAVPESGFRGLLKGIARDEILHARLGAHTLQHIRSEEDPRWIAWPGDQAIRKRLEAAKTAMRQRDVIEAGEADAFNRPEIAEQLLACGIPPSTEFLRVHMEALDAAVNQGLAFLGP